jgi:hypothetical protein
MDRLLQEIPLDGNEALELERLQRKKLEEDFDGDWVFFPKSESNDELESDDQSESDNDGDIRFRLVVALPETNGEQREHSQ